MKRSRNRPVLRLAAPAALVGAALIGAACDGNAVAPPVPTPPPTGVVVSFASSSVEVFEGDTVAIPIRYEVGNRSTPLSLSVAASGETAGESDFLLERTAFEIPAGRGLSGELEISLSAPRDRLISEGDETGTIRFLPVAAETEVRLGGSLAFTVREGGASPCPGVTISARPPAASETRTDRLGAGHLFTRLTLVREPAAAGATLDFRGPYYWEDRLAEFDFQPIAATRIARWSVASVGGAIRHEFDIEWPDETTLQEPDLEFGFLGGSCSGEPVASCSADGCVFDP